MNRIEGIYKVGQEEMPFCIQETILGLEISVDDALFMQCRHSNEYFGNVE